MEKRVRRRTQTPVDKEIGKAVRRFRLVLDLRQEELARLSSVSLSVISRLEHGHQSVSAERLRDIAMALGTTPDVLLGLR